MGYRGGMVHRIEILQELLVLEDLPSEEFNLLEASSLLQAQLQSTTAKILHMPIVIFIGLLGVRIGLRVFRLLPFMYRPWRTWMLYVLGMCVRE